MDIDQDLKEELQRNPDKTVEVILICTEYSDIVQAKLDLTTFKTTGRQQAQHGIIYGHICLSDLSALQKIKEIDSISLDSMQHIL